MNRKQLKVFILGVAVSVATVLGGQQFLEYQQLTQWQQSLHFTNTQSWDPSIVYIQLYKSSLISDEIILPPYPDNTSNETKQEIKALHELIAQRTPEKQKQIESEIYAGNEKYNGISYFDLLKNKPMTKVLVEKTHHELLGHIIRQKASFDRVRPSFLDPTLSTSIEVPGHPSYPSGHATESYFLALIFSQLDPENEENYLKSAERIAYNREIAGVHYRSDSQAGQQLAREYFKKLAENSWYTAQLERARSEW